jgi:murein DD-endopeptidase MepM/ murein hydrolase activator NlpD
MPKRVSRNVLQENLNVLLIPESGAEIASFRLKRVTLHAAMAVALLFAAGVGALLYGYLGKTFDTERASMLAQENDSLREEIDQIHGTIDMLRETVDQNGGYEDRALALAGLLDSEDLSGPLGLGGEEQWRGNVAPEDDLALTRLVEEAEIELDELVRTSESRRRLYEQVLDVLETRQKKFDHVPSIHPLNNEGWVSSGFGSRRDPFTGRRAFHSGLDIAARKGTEAVATADGVVTRSGRNGFFGLSVRIDHGNGIETVYGHNMENLVEEGERVKRGQPVSRVGSTGRSTGPHLHYGVLVDGKYVNPLAYILPEDVIVD